MRLNIGIYDSEISLRFPRGLAGVLEVVAEINRYYTSSGRRSMCAFPSDRNEFFPTRGVFHVRPDDRWKTAAFFGRVLRNFYGPKTVRFALFHASAVSDGRGAIVFLGHHAWGKTTLLRGFLSAGYSYLSDDMVAVNLKSGLLHPTLPVDHRVRFGSVSPPVPLNTVFLIRYSPQRDESEIHEIPPHKAFLSAMENLLNPTSVGEDSLKTLLRVFSGASSYRTFHRDWRDVLRFQSLRSS